MAYSAGYSIRHLPNLATGLNNQYDAGEILDTDIADMENIEVDSKSIKNAGGYVDYGSSEGPFWGIFNARFENGVETMIRQRQGTLEYDNGAGEWTECTLPTAGSPASTVVLTQRGCSFAMLNDTVLWSNGEDVVMSSSDGITWTLEGDLPKSQVLFNNGLNRILFLAQPGDPSRIDWSDINTPLTVGADSYQYFGKNDGQEIQDAALLPNGAMILFKTNRFYEISDVTLDTVSTSPIGEAPCVRYTVQSTENSVIWAGPDGKVYELFGGVPNFISDNIQRLNITKPQSMRAIYHNNKYRLAVPEGSNDYNSVEYVISRNIQSGRQNNPYVITKNTRYIGCYGREDREVGGSRRSRVYFGDSRKVAIGSPASIPGVFAWINQEHDQAVTQGILGQAQDCSLTTKFYTENGTYSLKRYVKYFINLKSSASQEITIGYRFAPFEAFTEIKLLTSAPTITWMFSDSSTGNFNEGFGFSAEADLREYKSLERGATEPRGIQFKISWSSIQDVEILSQAVKFLSKTTFY